MDLTRRATDRELLDLGVPEDEALASLGDLRFVNRRLGARAALLAAARPFLSRSGPARLLDVGCGSGDVSSFLATAMPGPVQVVGLDLKALHVRQAPAVVRPIVADARGLPFGPRTFDVVLVSLFLHHFDAPDASEVLRGLYSIARGALIVTDLRRARLPYVFGRLAFPWLFRSRVSVADGLVSIRRGFHDEELRAAFAEAGIPHVRIRRAFPYRLLAVAEQTGSH